MLLYSAGDPQYRYEFAERNHCHLRACFRDWRDFFQEGLGGGARGGTRPVSRGEPGLGHRSVARRPDWIRDQPGTRPGAAHHARDSSDCRERRLGLELRANSRDWTADWRRAGWLASPRSDDFLICAGSERTSGNDSEPSEEPARTWNLR